MIGTGKGVVEVTNDSIGFSVDGKMINNDPVQSILKTNEDYHFGMKNNGIQKSAMVSK